MAQEPMRKPAEVEKLSDEMQDVFDVLNGQPDLACVVAGAAFLDAGLESILRAHFRSRRVGDSLLRPDGPLGSFAARADLAYCLALVSKEYYQDLKGIAGIRNTLAHSHLQLTFYDPSVQQMCSGLRAWQAIGFSDVEATVDASVRQWAAGRNKFSRSVGR